MVANQNYTLEEVNSKFSECNTIMFTLNVLYLTSKNMYFIKYTNIVSFWPGKWSKTCQNNSRGEIGWKTKTHLER